LPLADRPQNLLNTSSSTPTVVHGRGASKRCHYYGRKVEP
jgi:hypothetical protein